MINWEDRHCTRTFSPLLGQKEGSMQGVTSLRALREGRFLTQQELANLSGVAKVTIARIETAVTIPTYATVRKLASALGVEPGELVPDPSLLRRPHRSTSSRQHPPVKSSSG